MQRLSLTARLTLLFAIGSSAVLLVLGWLTGLAIDQHFEQQDRETLSGQMQLAQRAIERLNAAQNLPVLRAQLRDTLIGHLDLVVQILGPDGQSWLNSGGTDFPPDRLRQASASTGPQLFQWQQGGHSYRAMTQLVRTGVTHWKPVVVILAVDTQHHTLFMRNFLQALWVIVVCAALAMGLIGWVAASRGLAPLRTMRERAMAVTAHQLDQRLPVDAVPAELAALAVSLNAMLTRIEAAFHRLSDFSSDIAHELRTPVCNLMTETQVVLSRERDAASYRRTLESNAEEYERLARMISEMLFLAKTEQEQTADWIAQHGEIVQLAPEVKNLFEFYEALAEENHVRLALHGECEVWADRLMLRRAVSNLLSNAVRHTPAGGTVDVTLSAVQAGGQLTVENPGPTLAPQHLDRLFERFYRADSSRQQSTGEGTGLGLAITRAIVQAHQGQIQAFSHDGRIRFCMTLPGAAGRAQRFAAAHGLGEQKHR